MKKLHVLFAMLMCCLLVVAGCGKKDDDQKVEDQQSENQQAEEKEEPVDIDLEEMMTGIREAYGENYLPNTPIDDTMLEEMFGLDVSLMEEKVAEMPMIGFHPDRVILVKAVEGKGGEVEAQLTAMRETLVEDSFQYPANLAKTEASVVVRNGDYVAFFLVGAPNENMDASEEDQLTFAQEETQKAVDIFNSFFE